MRWIARFRLAVAAAVQAVAVCAPAGQRDRRGPCRARVAGLGAKAVRRRRSRRRSSRRSASRSRPAACPGPRGSPRAQLPPRRSDRSCHAAAPQAARRPSTAAAPRSPPGRDGSARFPTARRHAAHPRSRTPGRHRQDRRPMARGNGRERPYARGAELFRGAHGTVVRNVTYIGPFRTTDASSEGCGRAAAPRLQGAARDPAKRRLREKRRCARSHSLGEIALGYLRLFP